MTTQGNSPLVPGIAATAGRVLPDDDSDRATDGGVPVGEADAQADAERTGAGGDDDDLSFPARAATPDVAGSSTDADGVPVGEADAEADRRRSGADDT